MNVQEKDTFAALRIPEFRMFIGSRLFLTLGVQMEALLVSWQIYKITKDPLNLGLIGLSEAIPFLCIALFAGHLADIIERKKIILTGIFCMLICSLSLLLISVNIERVIGFGGVVPIYCVIFLTGIARGILGPSLFAFMPQLVKPEIYTTAITWNSSTWQTASVAGPALGGLLFGIFSQIENSDNLAFIYCYGITSSLFVLAFFIMTIIASKPLPPSEESTNTYERLTAGIKFVWNNKIILTVMSLDLLAVLFGGATALLPMFADQILLVGASELGILRSANALGAVIMAVFMAFYPVKKYAGQKMLWAVAGFGVCMILFALSEYFWLSFGLLLISGIFDSVSVIVRATLIHTRTPEHMKGRVSAVNQFFIGSSNEIGTFESGLAARILGLIPSVIFGGFATLGVVAATSYISKELRRFNL